jgi:ABC-type lipoprotein release transport system permease subunit
VRAVRFRFRAEWRTRWRSWVALACLVGAVAGTAILLVAGSRRTGSAHERFLAEGRAMDVALVADCAEDDPCVGRLERLPAVLEATTVIQFPAHVETTAGRSLQPMESDPCYSGPGQLVTMTDPSGRWGRTINRHRFVAGRAANPSAPDEAVLSVETARRLRLDVDDELTVYRFGGQDCLATRDSWQPARRVRIVGIHLSPGEVRPPSGMYLQTVELTPAFEQRYGQARDRDEILIARLRAGASVRTLQAQARRAGTETFAAVTRADISGLVNRAIRPNEVSLLILGTLTAIAAAVVLGQVLARHAATETGDDGVLTALGMPRRGRLALAALRGVTLGLLAAAIAAVVAVLGSPVMPIGLARTVEPAPGVQVDLVAIGVGALATVAFVAGVTLLGTLVASRRRVRGARTKTATLANAAARAGFSPAAVSGARFALERGSGSAVVPVVSSFAGLTIAVAAVAGSLSFGAGLTHLRTTPRLVGWNWDVVLAYPEEGVPDAPSLEQARERVRAALNTNDIADAAMGTIWSPFPDGRDLQLGPDRLDVGGFIAFDGTARFGPSVIRGRKPIAADEIMVGPRTLADLDLHIGDRVEVVGQEGTWDTPGPVTTETMRIVGTGLAPMTTALGRGAVITLAGLQRLNSQATEQAWFVRAVPGANRTEVVDAFRSAFPGTPRTAIVPFGSEETTDLGLNLEQIGSVPLLFAVIMAIMAAAVLAHVLTVAARARRRDLAVLRALGFSRSQILRTLTWQSSIYAVGALAIGVPVGVALGRAAWRVYATNLGAVPEVVVPWPALVVAAGAAIVLAATVALIPAASVARTRPGAVLRAE